MFSPGVHAMLIQAHVAELARRTCNFNEKRILGEAGVATDRRQPARLDRAIERRQDRSVLEGRPSG